MVSAVERTHAQAMRVELETIAQFLQETLGQRLTAVAIGVRDPKTVGRYARGETPRKDDVERRLRALYQVAQVLLEHETDRTVRAWMMGANPQLDDESPIERLHNDDVRSVIDAARAFVVSG